MRNYFFKTSSQYIAFLICCILATSLQAQNNKDICENKNCSSNIFNVKLDEPLVPTPPNDFKNERTAKFRQAYFSFQQVKKQLRQQQRLAKEKKRIHDRWAELSATLSDRGRTLPMNMCRTPISKNSLMHKEREINLLRMASKAADGG